MVKFARMQNVQNSQTGVPHKMTKIAKIKQNCQYGQNYKNVVTIQISPKLSKHHKWDKVFQVIKTAKG